MEDGMCVVEQHRVTWLQRPTLTPLRNSFCSTKLLRSPITHHVGENMVEAQKTSLHGKEEEWEMDPGSAMFSHSSDL